VWSVRVNGHLAVGRLGARSDADLASETELLHHLDREGLTVPVPIPTADGRLFVDGLVVMTYLDGGPPETQADWRRVAGVYRPTSAGDRRTRGPRCPDSKDIRPPPSVGRPLPTVFTPVSHKPVGQRLSAAARMGSSFGMYPALEISLDLAPFAQLTA
jgi:hypothetical protein